MQKIINRAIEIIVYKPKMVLSLLVLITVLLAGGIANLTLDPSTEYLMPKNDPVYKLGERAKIVFADSKTFIIASLQASKGHKLFSTEVFHTIGQMVQEIEEYRHFNVTVENARLKTLLKLANVTIQEHGIVRKLPQDKSPTADESFLESQLDDVILHGDTSTINEADNTINSLENIISDKDYAQDNIWDMDAPLPADKNIKPSRKRNIYEYKNYQPVTLNEIKENLDEIAFLQTQTILLSKKMQDISYNKPLSKKEFKKFLEAWEDIYLFKSMMVLKIFNNPLSGQDIKGTTDELFSIDFVEQDENANFLYPQTEKKFNQYKEKLMLNPLNKGTLFSVNKKGDIEALAFNLIFRHLDNYETLAEYFWILLEKYDEKYNNNPLKIWTNGTTIFEKFINDYMKHDLKLFIPLSFLVMLLTFYFNFGSLRGVVLPSFAVLTGMVWTMGTMGYLGIRISVLVSILVPLLLVIGSSYSIHVFNQYMKNLKSIQSINQKEELKKSMAHIFPTVFLVALTTIISFFTLAPSQVVSLREFGIFAALGSLYSSVIAFLMLPAALSLLKPLPYKKFYASDNSLKKNFVEQLVEMMANLSIKHSKIIVLVFLSVVFISFFGIMRVKVETTPMVNFKADSYIRQSDAYLGEHFDGTFLINLVIDSGKEGGVKELYFLELLENIRQWTQQPEQKEKYMILHYNSFADFIKRMNMAMKADDTTNFKLPENTQSVTDYIEIFAGEDLDSDGRPDVFEQFVDPQYRRANIAIRTGTFNGQFMTTSSNKIIQQKLLEHLNVLKNPHGYKWFFVGDAPNFVRLAKYIVKSQFISVIFSLVIIFLLIFLLFKKLSIALIGMVPTVTGIVLIYGFMGYLNIPLDISRVILSGVAIGIGIDDTIHYVKTLTMNVQHSTTLENAIRATHRESGLAIVYTSVALILGFSVLVFSDFVPVYSLGYLVASVMLATTIGALLILPALIYFFNLRLKK